MYFETNFVNINYILKYKIILQKISFIYHNMTNYGKIIFNKYYGGGNYE